MVEVVIKNNQSDLKIFVNDFPKIDTIPNEILNLLITSIAEDLTKKKFVKRHNHFKQVNN